MRPALQHDQLRYRNEAFAIHHLIDDCPPPTVVRELIKNAVENAVLHKPPGRIEWFVEKVNGVRKLGLYNEGPGMSGDFYISSMSIVPDEASTVALLGLASSGLLFLRRRRK